MKNNNIRKQKGIYIHIPFCSYICLYCDFNEDYQKRQLIDEYIDALIKEFRFIDQSDLIKTVYIGGGTPSTMNEQQFTKLLKSLSTKVNLLKLDEFTIEARPEDLSLEKIKVFKKYGVNRISLAIQETSEELEDLVGKSISEKNVRQVIADLKKEDINNISVDLIFALPNQTISDLKKSIAKIISYEINHISIYPMTLDERIAQYNTPKKQLIVTSEKLEKEMYEFIINYLVANGFEHYELSSFSKNKNVAVHNSNYWKNLDYYGLGVEASGKLSDIRYNNISSIEDYITRIKLNNSVREEEKILSREEKLEEEFILGLQLLEGIDLNMLDKIYGINSYEVYKEVIDRHIREGNLALENNILKLTLKSLFKTNDVLSDFILS